MPSRAISSTLTASRRLRLAASRRLPRRRVSIAPLGASPDNLRLRAARRRDPPPRPPRLLLRGRGRRDHTARQRGCVAAAGPAPPCDGRLHGLRSVHHRAGPCASAPGDRRSHRLPCAGVAGGRDGDGTRSCGHRHPVLPVDAVDHRRGRTGDADPRDEALVSALRLQGPRCHARGRGCCRRARLRGTRSHGRRARVRHARARHALGIRARREHADPQRRRRRRPGNARPQGCGRADRPQPHVGDGGATCR